MPSVARRTVFCPEMWLFHRCLAVPDLESALGLSVCGCPHGLDKKLRRLKFSDVCETIPSLAGRWATEIYHVEVVSGYFHTFISDSS